ncbi:hypothetical protein HDG32_004069 [Paraburkholderia sp. CI2]|nr:hypothetical protein [Paraburkholderia sp. CI2]
MRLGAALLDAGNAAEALEHYRSAANGPFSSNPAVLQGLARAQFANGNASATQTRWKNRSPFIPSPASNPSLPCCMHGFGHDLSTGHARRGRDGAHQRKRRCTPLRVRRLANGAVRRCRPPACARTFRARCQALATPRP